MNKLFRLVFFCLILVALYQLWTGVSALAAADDYAGLFGYLSFNIGLPLMVAYFGIAIIISYTLLTNPPVTHPKSDKAYDYFVQKGIQDRTHLSVSEALSYGFGFTLFLFTRPSLLLQSQETRDRIRRLRESAEKASLKEEPPDLNLPNIPSIIDQLSKRLGRNPNVRHLADEYLAAAKQIIAKEFEPPAPIPPDCPTEPYIPPLRDLKEEGDLDRIEKYTHDFQEWQRKRDAYRHAFGDDKNVYRVRSIHQDYYKKIAIPDVEKHISDAFYTSFSNLLAALPLLSGPSERPQFQMSIYGTNTASGIISPFTSPIFSRTVEEIVDKRVAAALAIKAKHYEENSPAENLARLPDALTSVYLSSYPATIPPKSRFEGTWIVAPRGRGKTTLLSNLLKNDLNAVAKGKASIIIFDSKGQFIDHAKRLARFSSGDLHNKLVLLEPDASLAINPLDLGASTGHTISLLEYVFSGLLESKPTPLQSTLFRSVLMAMKEIPEATFSTFRQFLIDGWKPYREHLEKLHPEDRDFFLKGEFDNKKYNDARESLLWRIRDLTTKVPMLRDMFRSPTTKIDIGKEMDAGKVIIIDNSIAKLGGGSEFFARFFIALILAAAQQRSKRKSEDKLPVFIYLDEAQDVIARDDSVATILHQCRSQNIAMIFAHQAVQAQIKSEDVKAALADCAIRMTNPDDEAHELAPRFRCKAEDLQNIPKGSFALYVRDHLQKPIVVSVPDDPIWKKDTWPKMTDEDFREVRRQMAERYSYFPPAAADAAQPSTADDNNPSENW